MFYVFILGLIVYFSVSCLSLRHFISKHMFIEKYYYGTEYLPPDPDPIWLSGAVVYSAVWPLTYFLLGLDTLHKYIIEKFTA